MTGLQFLSVIFFLIIGIVYCSCKSRRTKKIDVEPPLPVAIEIPVAVPVDELRF